MLGMTPTDYIKELHQKLDALTRENERLKYSVELLQNQLDVLMAERAEKNA